jgi:nucleoside phosphorylase
MGKENTTYSLEYIFKNYTIYKAVNIGIAGCSDTSIPIGQLFCTNQTLKDIPYIQLKTVSKTQTISKEKSCLYDMEASVFANICLKYLDKKYIFVFKVVSDYLDDTIPTKEFVKQLIKQNIKSLEKWI